MALLNTFKDAQNPSIKVKYSVEIEFCGPQIRVPSSNIQNEIDELLKEFERGKITADKFAESLAALLQPAWRVTAYEEDAAEKSFSRPFEYLRQNLPAELEAVVNQMLFKELGIMQFFSHGADVGARARKEGIELILKETGKRLRARLPTRIGKPKTADRHDYIPQKKEFLKKLVTIIEEIDQMVADGEKIKLNKTTVAERFAESHVWNPEKSLSHYLDIFNLTFDEVVKSYRNFTLWARVYEEDIKRSEEGIPIKEGK